MSESPVSEAVPESAHALIGSTISDRYRIETILGAGGMGAVYRAEHLLLNKAVAIKVLHPEMSGVTEVVARFEREAKAAAHIEHPHVAAATDFGRLDDGSFFLVLEYIEGKSLREELEQGPLAPARAAHIVRQILSGLIRAHGAGIVHRDLKPENVMLVLRDGDPDFVKILDFGIAKVESAAAQKVGATKALTQAGLVYGTPEYMAPEQALGQEVDARADLYAVGVMLYEMLTGHRPFVADDPVRLLGMVISQDVPPMDVEVPPELERVTMSLLARLRDDRVPDAKAALDLLGGLSITDLAPASATTIVGGGVHVPAAHASTRLVPEVTRKIGKVPLAPVVGGGLGIIVILIVAIVLVARGRPSHEEGKAPDGTPSAAAKDKRVVTDDEIQAAEMTGPDAVERLFAENPGDPRIERALARSLLSAKNPERAMEVYEGMLKRDASLASDKGFREALVGVAYFDGGLEAAVASMSARMGTLGPDVLYDLAVGAKIPQKVQKRAQDAIATDVVLEHASTALKVALELRAARRLGGQPMCTTRKALFVRAKDEGDMRAMPYLSELTSRRGCGFLKRSDCFPCLRDGSLEAAISAINSRDKGKP